MVMNLLTNFRESILSSERILVQTESDEVLDINFKMGNDTIKDWNSEHT